MSTEKKTTIKDLAFMYQAALKANFLPEVFMHSMGTEINNDLIKAHLKSKVNEVLEQLEVIKELLDGEIETGDKEQEA